MTAAPPVIDFHTHAYPDWLRARREKYLRRDATFGELFADPKARMATADELIAAMDADGVDLSVVMGIGWTDQGLAREVNDYVIESAMRYPGRLVGFAGVNPAWGADAAREAERCAAAGLRGVGEIHPDSQGFDLGDARTMAPLMDAARELRLVVTTHSSEPVGHAYPGKGRTRPESLWRFAQGFPDVSIVCAHWGGGLPFYALMPEVMDGIGSVYFDTAASPFLYDRRVFEVGVSLVGSSRILLGSDYPLLGARRLLRQVERASLPDADKDAIRGGAAARLLGLGSEVQGRVG